MKFQVTSEVSVSFTTEAIRFSKNRAIVRIQVTQMADPEDDGTSINSGYCYADIDADESLSEVAARVARNPYTKALGTTWEDDRSTEGIRAYYVKSNDYEMASAAHELGPMDNWETVHTYVEGSELVAVQVAETYGAWYYRTEGSSNDGVYDEFFGTREEAVLAAHEVKGD